MRLFNDTAYTVAGGDRMKKNLLNKKKMPAFYLPMYGINNWCSIRAAAIEELEEQEAAPKQSSTKICLFTKCCNEPHH